MTLQKRNDSPKQTVSSSSHGIQSFTVPQFNTKEPPKQSSILAGLQFTPAPPRQPADAQGSPDKTPSTSPLKMTTTVPASSGLSGFKPLFHGGTFSVSIHVCTIVCLCAHTCILLCSSDGQCRSMYEYVNVFIA